jgi:hypothetical protein
MPCTRGYAVKKTIAAAALVISLVAVGCSSNSATPAPTTPAEAAESMVAEVEDAAASVAAEVEEAQESVAAEVEDAVESLVAEASPAA